MAMLLGSSLYSQQIAYSKITASKENEVIASSEGPNKYDRVSIVSKNRDTLWLADNSLGKMIAQTWSMGTTSKHYQKVPVIIYVKDFNNMPPVKKNSRKKIKS